MKKMRALILDLDHCLYRDPDCKNELYFQGAVAAALRLGLFQDFEKAAAAVGASIKTHKSEIEGLILEHGIDRHSIFKAYHEDSFPLFKAVVTPVEGLAASLQRAVEKHDLKVGVLTHSAREWALPMLDHLGFSGVVSPRTVWAWNDEKINFLSKSRFEEPFLHACDMLGVKPEEAGMADDLERNLVIPARLGMTTIQVSWLAEALDVPKPPYLTHRVETLKHFVDMHFS